MPRERVPIRFGEGLDRESGIMAVQPSSFFDLRNAYLHEGKLIVRDGFTSAGTGEFDEIDFILGGHGLRSDRLGIVAGWSQLEETVYLYRVAPDLSTVELLGEYVNDLGWGDTIPRLIFAEVFGRVFIAHDEPAIAGRAPTAYYDGQGSGDLIKYLFSSWADGTPGESAGESAESVASEDKIRFRGVVRHLSYLVGWGFGTQLEPRPEFVRISLPADPTTFDPNHYFIAGDRNDPVIGARPVGGDPGVLKVFKRQEAYDLRGTDRRSFGLFLADPRYGLVAGRALTDVGEAVVAWSEEGPRLWEGPGASGSLEIPLGLDDWEPTDLIDEGEEEYGFAHFIPRERIAWFQFNRRVYALTTRIPGRWRWSYQELPFDAYGAMTFYEGEVAAIAPTGYPDYNETLEESAGHANPTIPAGTYVDLAWRNVQQAGDETVEVWLKRTTEPVPPGPPSIITDTDVLMAVRFADHDADQPRVLLDQSGGGGHLYFGPTDAQDQLLGYGPGGVGKVGVVGSDDDRGLGLLNTGQQYNLGDTGVDQVRITVNFNAVFDNGAQGLCGQFDASGRYSWQISLLATGVISMGWSDDGTTQRTVTSVNTLPVTGGFSDFEDCWIRCTYDLSVTPATGLIEYSTDGGSSWLTLLAATNFAVGGNFNQPPATDHLEIATLERGTASNLRGGAVFYIEAEEDTGSGFVQAWEWDAADAEYTDFVELGNQGNTDAADPTLGANNIRVVRNTSEMRSYENRATADLTHENLYSVDPGDFFTVIFACAIDEVSAGAGGFHVPISCKSTGAAGNPGWNIENSGSVNGYATLISNGGTQSSSGTSTPANDDIMAAIVLEFDGPGGEVRQFAEGEAEQTGAYSDQGSGTHQFPIMIGRTGTAGFGASLDLAGLYIIRRELTDEEKTTVAEWLLENATT